MRSLARKLVDEFFFRFLPPERLHSDQGKNFESAVVSEVCRLLGIVKSRTTPYHPQSDGFVECFNQTLLDMLSKAVHERPFEWEDHIRRLCLTYNSSVNQITRHTSFYLMFGRQVRMPVDLMYGNSTPHSTTLPQYVADLRSNLTAVYEQVTATMSAKRGRRSYMTAGCTGSHSSLVI